MPKPIANRRFSLLRLDLIDKLSSSCFSQKRRQLWQGSMAKCKRKWEM